MAKRKRILHVVDGFRMGGAENKLLELIGQLDKSKYEQLLANVGPGGPLQSQFEKLGIEIRHFPRRWGFDPMPLLKLVNFIRKNEIDIVQTTLFWSDIIGTIAARLAGVRSIISWETVSHEGDPYHNNFQRRYGSQLISKINKLIVAVSHEVKTSLIQRRGVDPDKIRVIHYGVDLTHFHPNGEDVRPALRKSLNISDDTFLIGIIARLEPWKGHRVFIEAFSKLTTRFPKVQALFIGDGSLRAELEKQVESYQLQSKVHFLGVRKDVADLLNCLDLCVLPSMPGEGLPNVLLEAMASKKAVIATDVGGVPELVKSGYNGYVVKSGDVEALKSALEKVIIDSQHLKALERNALQTVQTNFSLTKQISSFEEVYDQI